MRACVRACVRAYVRVCVCVYVCVCVVIVVVLAEKRGHDGDINNKVFVKGTDKSGRLVNHFVCRL